MTHQAQALNTQHPPHLAADTRADAYTSVWREPQLRDLLADPITHAMMDSDHVQRKELDMILDSARHGLLVRIGWLSQQAY